jgi:hypothetical protein
MNNINEKKEQIILLPKKSNDDKIFKCIRCNITFYSYYTLKRHLEKKIKCNYRCNRCNSSFTRKSALDKHALSCYKKFMITHIKTQNYDNLNIIMNNITNTVTNTNTKNIVKNTTISTKNIILNIINQTNTEPRPKHFPKDVLSARYYRYDISHITEGIEKYREMAPTYPQEYIDVAMSTNDYTSKLIKNIDTRGHEALFERIMENPVNRNIRFLQEDFDKIIGYKSINESIPPKFLEVFRKTTDRWEKVLRSDAERCCKVVLTNHIYGTPVDEEICKLLTIIMEHDGGYQMYRSHILQDFILKHIMKIDERLQEFKVNK